MHPFDWFLLIYLAAAAIVITVDFVRSGDKSSILRTGWRVFWLLVLFFIIDEAIFLLLKEVFPTHRLRRYLFGFDEDGNPFDRRSTLSTILAIGVTYLVIRGWRSHKEQNPK